MPRRPALAQHRPARRSSDAVRCHRVQRRDRLHRLLRPPPPCLIAIGGFSGSGKSTVAQALAPLIAAVPGAVVIRSDEVRKQLCGVGTLQRLGPEGYATEVTRRVYDVTAHRAAQVVAGGHAAIVDAVYARSGDRHAIERIAGAAQVPFVGVWLEAPEPVLIARAERRRLDASDADATVIREQLARDPGAIDWHRVDAAGALDEVQTATACLLRERLNVEVVRRDPQTASPMVCGKATPATRRDRGERRSEGRT